MTDASDSGAKESEGDQGTPAPPPEGDTEPVEYPEAEPVPAPASDSKQEPGFREEQATQAERGTGANLKRLLKDLKVTDWITAVATAVIAAATIWSVIVISGQLAEMKSAGDDTARLVAATQNLVVAARQQAEATNNLAKAARDQTEAAKAQAFTIGELQKAVRESAAGARAIAQTQLAAYIAVSWGDCDDGDGKKPPQCTAVFTNTGETPTREMRAILHVAILKYPFPGRVEEIEFPPISTTENTSVLAKGESSRLTIKAARVLTAEEITAVHLGTIRIYYLGRFTFRNEFSRVQTHHFCAIFGGPDKATLELCPSYND